MPRPKVYLRLRHDIPESCSSLQVLDEKTILFSPSQVPSQGSLRCEFAQVFGATTPNSFLNGVVAASALEAIAQGINASVLAYGPSGSGKTHTILSDDGLLFHLAASLFQHCPGSLEVSILELYKDQLSDLAVKTTQCRVPPSPRVPASPALRLRESREQQVYVENLTHVLIATPAAFRAHVQDCLQFRRVHATQINSSSSRSHLIIFVRPTGINDSVDFVGGGVPSEETKTTATAAGTLCVVDLAGAERASRSGCEGTAFAEAKQINLSLTALGQVVSSSAAGAHYRDHKLTRLLQPGLRGAAVALVCCVDPRHFAETHNALLFAKSTANLKCTRLAQTRPQSQDDVVRALQRQVAELSRLLANRDSNRDSEHTPHEPTDTHPIETSHETAAAADEAQCVDIECANSQRGNAHFGDTHPDTDQVVIATERTGPATHIHPQSTVHTPVPTHTDPTATPGRTASASIRLASARRTRPTTIGLGERRTPLARSGCPWPEVDVRDPKSLDLKTDSRIHDLQTQKPESSDQDLGMHPLCFSSSPGQDNETRLLPFLASLSPTPVPLSPHDSFFRDRSEGGKSPANRADWVACEVERTPACTGADRNPFSALSETHSGSEFKITPCPDSCVIESGETEQSPRTLVEQSNQVPDSGASTKCSSSFDRLALLVDEPVLDERVLENGAPNGGGPDGDPVNGDGLSGVQDDLAAFLFLTSSIAWLRNALGEYAYRQVCEAVDECILVVAEGKK